MKVKIEPSAEATKVSPRVMKVSPRATLVLNVSNVLFVEVGAVQTMSTDAAEAR